MWLELTQSGKKWAKNSAPSSGCRSTAQKEESWVYTGTILTLSLYALYQQNTVSAVWLELSQSGKNVFFFIHRFVTGATIKRGRERSAMRRMQWSSTTGENYQQSTVSAVWLELSQSGKKCVFFHRFVTGTTKKREENIPPCGGCSEAA